MVHIGSKPSVGLRLTEDRAKGELPDVDHVTLISHDPEQTKVLYQKLEGKLEGIMPLLHFGTNLMEGDDLVDRIIYCYTFFENVETPPYFSFHFGHPYLMKDIKYEEIGNGQVRVVKVNSDVKPIPPQEYAESALGKLKMIFNGIKGVQKRRDKVIVAAETMDAYPVFVEDLQRNGLSKKDAQQIYSPQFISETITTSNSLDDRVRVLLDWGHAQVSAYHLGLSDDEFIRPLLPFIFEVHLSDAAKIDGELRDAHNMFTRWDKFEEYASQMPYLRFVTLEVNDLCTIDEIEVAVEEVRKRLDRIAA